MKESVRFFVYKNTGVVLNKLKSKYFRASSLSTYDFSTLKTINVKKDCL